MTSKITYFDTKTCSKCGYVKHLGAFYDNPAKRHGVQSYCKSCFNRYTTNRFVRRKVFAIQYKGAACEHCGLTLLESNFAVFDFHHRDPAMKKASFTKIRRWSWDRAKKELDKTTLLCANCHRTVHHKLDGLKLSIEGPLEW
jgi:predicted HNH restriction endonuclease